MRIAPSRHALTTRHAVLDRSIVPPFPSGTRTALLGLGCFWGAERVFWQQQDVHVTAVGYAGGTTVDPTYREVCNGNTGHAEVVLVVFEDNHDALSRLLDVFWESHDPTQGMRQGNDIGSQYRSTIFLETESDRELAEQSRDRYQQALNGAGFGPITTEIGTGVDFYYAEDYHQQYLAKNPAGYCGLGGTGVAAR
jgi:peptide-methionine (S)-S-oxide reductase